MVDEEGVSIPGAVVRVQGVDKETHTSTRGEYWRILVPGEYRFKVCIHGGALEDSSPKGSIGLR